MTQLRLTGIAVLATAPLAGAAAPQLRSHAARCDRLSGERLSGLFQPWREQEVNRSAAGRLREPGSFRTPLTLARPPASRTGS